MATIYTSDKTALWFQEECGNALKFLGCHDLNGLTVPRGEITISRKRSGKGKFKATGVRRQTPDTPTVTLRLFRADFDLLLDSPCPPTVYVMYSNCGADNDPTNYDFVDILEDLYITEETQENVSNALAEDGNTDVGGDIVVEAAISFLNRVTHKPVTATQVDVSDIRSHIVESVAVCDKEAICGDCDTNTKGCQTVWLVTNGVAGSIGTPAAIRKSTDRGSTWTTISNPFSDTDDSIIKVRCDGNTVILVNGEASSYAYSNDGSTFTEVLTPTQIISDVAVVGSTRIWMSAAAGFIYYSENQGQSVSTQTAGDITAQNLNAISMASGLLGYAVGNANAFLRTTNGSDWEAVTGPSVGVNLTAVAAIADTEIVLVGDASGNIFRSDDKGATWTTSFTAATATAGGIVSIAACNCNVMLFAANNAALTDGSVYKTINGGNTWTSQAVDTDTGLTDLVCCNLNEYWLTGNDGFIDRISGPSYLDGVTGF